MCGGKLQPCVTGRLAATHTRAAVTRAQVLAHQTSHEPRCTDRQIQLIDLIETSESGRLKAKDRIQKFSRGENGGGRQNQGIDSGRTHFTLWICTTPNTQTDIRHCTDINNKTLNSLDFGLKTSYKPHTQKLGVDFWRDSWTQSVHCWQESGFLDIVFGYWRRTENRIFAVLLFPEIS